MRTTPATVDDEIHAPALSDPGVDAHAGASHDLGSSYLLTIPEAARLVGLPLSTFRKSFISPDKRPKRLPGPPPHVRMGRAIYVLADKLPLWIKELATASDFGGYGKRRPGRPTVTERRAARLDNSAEQASHKISHRA